MKAAALAVVLAGCSLYEGVPVPPDAGCESSTNRCACGCDAAPPLDVEGDLTLHQTATSQACAAPAPRDPLVFTVVDGPWKTLSVAPPTLLANSWLTESYDYANGGADVSDTWGDATVTLSYGLSLTPDGRITGSATGTFADGQCDLTVAIEGTYNPS